MDALSRLWQSGTLFLFQTHHVILNWNKFLNKTNKTKFPFDSKNIGSTVCKKKLARDGFFNISTKKSPRAMRFSPLEREQYFLSKNVKIWLITNWPIRWTFAWHFVNDILKVFFIGFWLSVWPFDRENCSPSIYERLTFLACFIQEL